MTKARVGSKLTVIADQIRYLQEQARKVGHVIKKGQIRKVLAGHT